MIKQTVQDAPVGEDVRYICKSVCFFWYVRVAGFSASTKTGKVRVSFEEYDLRRELKKNIL
jgi:hypothetical protein